MRKHKEIPEAEFVRLERIVRAHLAELRMEEALPELASWNSPGNSQKILNLVRDLCDDTLELRDQSNAELEEIEGKLMDEKCNLSDEILRLQRKLNMRKQHLQELKTLINREELEIKEQKRQFLLKAKPKQAQIERLERRRRSARL